MAKITASVPEKARVLPKSKRRILVCYRTEGFVHNSIPFGNEAIRQMGERTGAFSADFSDKMDVFSAENLKRYDAVVFMNTTTLQFENQEYRKALIDFLNSGKGLIGFHAASDNFPTWSEAQELIGGIFHSHPWGSDAVVAVKLDDPKHTLNAAFEGKGFWLQEEIYQIVGPYSREKQRVLMSLDMSKDQNRRDKKDIVREDNDFPIAWIKTTDKGTRVFYTSLGHNKEIFMSKVLMKHFLDGIQFALGDMEADCVPSAKLSSVPEPALAPMLLVSPDGNKMGE